MQYLSHQGILLPKPYQPKGLHIKIKDQTITLTPHQEEMAVAWNKKQGTDYVKDPIFIKNFFQDFTKALGIQNNPLTPEDIDFTEVTQTVEREKLIKASLSKEEKKRQAQERKQIREENKQKYGYADVDGVKTELGNYMAEPPSIFMGRGQHPLRGRWKPEVKRSDVTLNLSRNAPRPPGIWKEIVWQPNSMWIAKWDDPLRGREKYIWLADSSQAKQQKEIDKFNKAKDLANKIDQLQNYIRANLQSPELKIRKIATVAYLVEELKLRVGDEKDPDEADTVGATTLRPNHIAINAKDRVTFDFLGKDSVRWQKEVTLPEEVVANLQEFIDQTQKQTNATEATIFNGIRSEHVNTFLSEILPGLTAKVFRTYYASQIVKNSLEKANISPTEPIFVKKHVATMANLEAAIMLNHKRKPPKNWEESLSKKIARLNTLRDLPKKTKAQSERLQSLDHKIKEFRDTREYNLRTSLKSYIDPREYYSWGKTIDFDWRLYYPKTLQTKFSWVEK